MSNIFEVKCAFELVLLKWITNDNWKINKNKIKCLDYLI